MKSSLPQGKGKNEAEINDRTEPTPTDPFGRPQLVRSPPERLSDISRSLSGRRSSQSSTDARKVEDDVEKHQQSASAVGRGSRSSQSKDETSSADEERLAKLKDEMNTKLLQQRSRRSYGAPKSDASSPRVAAIQEGIKSTSPQSINATLARTASNESTESSATIRAKGPASPIGNAPLRTPSYPFPYVPGTPKGLSSHFHEPFTSLSPTATSGPTSNQRNNSAASDLRSGETTPAAIANAFMPPGTYHESQNDPRFPTPNLYDMVLHLNAEPGLEQWWTTVSNLMHDHFQADRATLVVPRDPSDIENVSVP